MFGVVAYSKLALEKLMYPSELNVGVLINVAVLALTLTSVHVEPEVGYEGENPASKL